MGKKKFKILGERVEEKCACEEKYERALQDKGFEIIGYAWYYEFTDYLCEQDGITVMARCFRIDAKMKRIQVAVDLVFDTWQLKKKFETKEKNNDTSN